MKLLLDAPEGGPFFQHLYCGGLTVLTRSALYTYLAREEYLPAAYLWLVARMVKQGMSSMTDDVKAVSCLSPKPDRN